MIDSTSLLANTYLGISPMFNFATIVCDGRYDCASSVGEGVATAFVVLFGIIMLAVCILIIVSTWKVYQKAGQPGWASIVPIYNFIVFLRIVKRPWWWIFLCFIPIVTIVINVIILHDLAKAFGKGVGFMLGLLFLPFVFYPILAFGDAKYTFPSTGVQPASV